MYWWAGELANHYEPWGLSMAQFNKVIKLSQYVFGLIAIFELVQFSQVMRHLNFASRVYYITNKIPYYLGIFPMLLIPKLISGSVSLIKKEITSQDFLHSIFIPVLKREYTLAKDESHSSRMAKAFKWLSENPLSDNVRRYTIFISFAVLSLTDIFSS